MQTPTGRPRSAGPIPRPRPHGPADLGILADDLDHLAAMNAARAVPKPGPGIRSGLQVSEPYPVSNADLELAGHDGDGGYDEVDDHPSLPAPAPAGPIFVDASGRRRKVARRASLAAVAAVAGYAGLLAVSFAGGPIPPKVLLPVPGMPAGKDPAPASSSVGQTGAPAADKTGSTEHPAAAAGHSTTGAAEHRTQTTRPSAPGPSTSPATPQPTAPASTTQPSPTPTLPGGTTGSTSATGHGNPKPPGHTRSKPSSGPTT